MVNFDDIFSFDEVDETISIEYDVLPAGEYLAEIKEAEVVDFDGKNGSACQMLKVVFEVKDAAQSGKKVWHRMTFLHGAADTDKGCARAQQIGRVQLKRLFLETDTGGSNPDDLIGRSLLIRTKIDKWQGKDGKSGESAAIVDFYKAGGDSDTVPF